MPKWFRGWLAPSVGFTREIVDPLLSEQSYERDGVAYQLEAYRRTRRDKYYEDPVKAPGMTDFTLTFTSPNGLRIVVVGESVYDLKDVKDVWWQDSKWVWVPIGDLTFSVSVDGEEVVPNASSVRDIRHAGLRDLVLLAIDALNAWSVELRRRRYEGQVMAEEEKAARESLMKDDEARRIRNKLDRL